MKKITQKLMVRRETLRLLTKIELTDARGGGVVAVGSAGANVCQGFVAEAGTQGPGDTCAQFIKA